MNADNNNNDYHNDNANNCVFCCLQARLIPDPTQHSLPDARLLYFRGHALRNRELINHGQNPNIVIRRPILYYIDVVREFRADPEAEFQEVLWATYVRGTVLRPGDDEYQEESDHETSNHEHEIQIINHLEELNRRIQQRFPDAQGSGNDRDGWVQVRREDDRWFDPHFHQIWIGDWIGERMASGVVCDLHRDYRFWFIIIGPPDNADPRVSGADAFERRTS